MKLNQNQFFFLLMFFSIICFQNCKKNSCKVVSNVDTFFLSNTLKAKLLNTTDTLVYISEMGDTAMLTGKYLHYYNEAKHPGITNECPSLFTAYGETVEKRFESKNKELFYLQSSISADEYVGSSPSSLNFIINSYFYAQYQFNYAYQQDSVLINNKYIRGNLFYSQNYTFLLLYNEVYGFIRIKFNGGKTWTLKNV